MHFTNFHVCLLYYIRCVKRKEEPLSSSMERKGRGRSLTIKGNFNEQACFIGRKFL